MLVLSRKQGQTIRLDNDIMVMVVSTHGGVVKLGIKAPKTVQIWRGELPPRAEGRDDATA